MSIRMRVLLSLVLILACFTTAESKKKSSLPGPVLAARTFFVLIDPDAGSPVTGPLDNKTARGDVEVALMNWGRLRLVETMSMADLVITVRKGNGKMVQPAIDGEPTNDRPVAVQPNDNGIRIGGQQGRNPDAAQTGPQSTRPGVGTEVGPAEDTFMVYMGSAGAVDPLERAPVWRYTAKNALRSPDVPAVGEFRKAIEEAEKQQQQQQQQQQKQQQQKPASNP